MRKLIEWPGRRQLIFSPGVLVPLPGGRQGGRGETLHAGASRGRGRGDRVGFGCAAWGGGRQMKQALVALAAVCLLKIGALPNILAENHGRSRVGCLSVCEFLGHR